MLRSAPTKQRLNITAVRIIERCYYELRGDLYAYVARLINDQEMAKDIVNDAILDSLYTPQKLRTTSAVRAFLYVTCRNKSFNYSRYGSGFKKKLEVNVWDPDTLQQYPDIDDQVLRDEVMKDEVASLWKAVEGLSGQQRTVIIELYFDKRTTADVAAKLGLPEAHVRAIKSKALNRLRHLLGSGFLLVASFFLDAA